MARQCPVAQCSRLHAQRPRLAAFTRATPRPRAQACLRRAVSPADVAQAADNNAVAVAQRSLVVAVDDDKVSWEAVRYTLQELFRDGDVLHLLHVIPKDSISIPVPHSSLASMSYAGDSLDFESVLEEHAMQFIRQTMVGLADARKARCQVDIIRGSSRECIGAAICKTADELQASLIVVPGWRSLSVFDRFFGQDRTYGQYVAQHASRPVCVYQPPQQLGHQ